MRVADLRGVGEVEALQIRRDDGPLEAEVVEGGHEVGALRGDDGLVVLERREGGGGGVIAHRAEADLERRREIRAGVARDDGPGTARGLAKDEEGVAETGHLQGRAPAACRERRRGHAVDGVLLFVAVAPRRPRCADALHDPIFATSGPRRGRDDRRTRRAHQQAGESVVCARRTGAGDIGHPDISGDHKIAGDIFEGEFALIILIPAGGARDHDERAGACGVDVVSGEPVHSPTLDGVEPREVGKGGGIRELVGERREVILGVQGDEGEDQEKSDDDGGNLHPRRVR